MIIDIGGGTREIAVIALGGIVVSHSLRVGGNRFDEAIATYIRKKYNLMVGERTAEEVKIQIGTALPLERELTMEVRGRDLIAGLPRTIPITSREVMEAIEAPLQQLVAAVRSVLEQTPPELSSDIIDKGMVMSGGGALLRNIDKLLTQVTGVPCHVAENPLDCVALGTGLALEHFDFFKKSLVQTGLMVAGPRRGSGRRAASRRSARYGACAGARSAGQRLPGATRGPDRQSLSGVGAVRRQDRPLMTRAFIDLHCHTSASFDCLARPGDVVRAAAERGLTHLAITDHDRIDGALEARELAPAGLTVIIGEEVRTADGDLIAAFLERASRPGMSAPETIAAAREQGGLVGIPHPFDRLRGSMLLRCGDGGRGRAGRLGRDAQRPARRAAATSVRPSSRTSTGCPASPCRTRIRSWRSASRTRRSMAIPRRRPGCSPRLPVRRSCPGERPTWSACGRRSPRP